MHCISVLRLFCSLRRSRPSRLDSSGKLLHNLACLLTHCYPKKRANLQCLLTHVFVQCSRTAPPAPLSVPQSPSLHASCSSAAPSSSQPRGINSNMQSVVAASARLAASSEPLWRQQLDSMWKQPMHLSTDQLFANARSRERFLQPSQSLHSHASPGTAHETALTLRQPAQRSASALKPSVLRSFEPRMVGAAGVNTSSAYNTSSATGAAIASSTAVDAQPAGHSGSSSTSASVGSRGSTHGLDCGQADVKTGVKSTARPSHVIAINAGAGVPPPRLVLGFISKVMQMAAVVCISVSSTVIRYVMLHRFCMLQTRFAWRVSNVCRMKAFLA